jgi:large subunit ribosomal protein L4
MLQVPVYNIAGEKVEMLQIDDARFGTEVNVALLKQAIVNYHANKRQGTVATKTRHDVEGSTRKLFRQKGTGNARRGPIRSNIMKGGGRAFGKRPRDYRQDMPQKMRQAALKSAILAKILGEDLLVVDGLKTDKPKTKFVAGVLNKLKINRSCLLTLPAHDDVLYKSARNIPDITVTTAAGLNAFDVATRVKMLVTREAMDVLLGKQA